MLSKIENGRMIPTIPTLFAIIDKLGVSPETFFSELHEKDQFPGYMFIPQSNYVSYVKEENVTGFDYYSILDHSMRADPFRYRYCILVLKPSALQSLPMRMNIST